MFGPLPYQLPDRDGNGSRCFPQIETGPVGVNIQQVLYHPVPLFPDSHAGLVNDVDLEGPVPPPLYPSPGKKAGPVPVDRQKQHVVQPFGPGHFPEVVPEESQAAKDGNVKGGPGA